MLRRAVSLLLIILAAGYVGFALAQMVIEPEVIVQERLTVKLPDSYYNENYPAPITVAQALEYLRECRLSHQRRVDMSKYKPLPAFEGDAEFHAKWVERYDQIRELILKLEEGE